MLRRGGRERLAPNFNSSGPISLCRAVGGCSKVATSVRRPTCFQLWGLRMEYLEGGYVRGTFGAALPDGAVPHRYGLTSYNGLANRRATLPAQSSLKPDLGGAREIELSDRAVAAWLRRDHQMVRARPGDASGLIIQFARMITGGQRIHMR
jgi:hypothetical protein